MSAVKTIKCLIKFKDEKLKKNMSPKTFNLLELLTILLK